MEKLRHRDDGMNSFIAGGFTSMVVAAEALGPRGLVMAGLTGGLFGLGMYKI